MPKFSRLFPVSDLKEWDSAHPGNTIRVLFDHWCLPGEKANKKASLRLAIRKGYLNFYIKGQSVAKLSFSRKGPRLEIAQAYVSGIEKTRVGKSPLGNALPFYGETLAQPETAALVEKWIRTARTYASAEKWFVDDLIASNLGIIDIEMALPASEINEGKKVAPRMDIVNAQVAGDGAISIVFWEAKCATNPQVRASGDSKAKVVSQLRNYESWMEQKGRIDEVQGAYRSAAIHLEELFDAFRKDGDHPCRRIWQRLSSSGKPEIVKKPALVIGNYWPDVSIDETASQRVARSAKSFEANGHRKKLQREGITVHEVGPHHQRGGPTISDQLLSYGD